MLKYFKYLRGYFLSNLWIKEGFTSEIRKYFELNDNENTTYQNVWDVAKAVLREKCMPSLQSKDVYILKNSLSCTLKICTIYCM